MIHHNGVNACAKKIVQMLAIFTHPLLAIELASESEAGGIEYPNLSVYYPKTIPNEL